jgi:DNA-binding transcriptional LysR family regulator
MIEEQIAKMEISLHTIMQLDSIESVTLMVHHDLGVSIVPHRSVELLLRLPIKIVSFGDPPLFRPLGLVQIKGSPKNHLCNAVFKQLLKVCSQDEAANNAAIRPATLEDEELQQPLQTAAPGSAAE